MQKKVNFIIHWFRNDIDCACGWGSTVNPTTEAIQKTLEKLFKEETNMHSTISTALSNPKYFKTKFR